VSVSGSHQQPFQNIPPTGKQVSITAIDIIRIADSKIVEHWGVMDQLALLQQLGAIST
jgi:predicted ester cyclase